MIAAPQPSPPQSSAAAPHDNPRPRPLVTPRRLVRSLGMLSIGIAGFVALVALGPRAVIEGEPRYLALGLFCGVIAMVRMLGRFETPG